MTDINELIDGRNESYGDAWAKTGEVLKAIAPDVEKLLQTYPRAYLPFVTIICKAIRACSTPTHKDHWADIAGYATLVLNDLEKREQQTIYSDDDIQGDASGCYHMYVTPRPKGEKATK